MRLFPFGSRVDCVSQARKNIRRNVCEELRQQKKVANGANRFRRVQSSGNRADQLIAAAHQAAKQIQHAPVVQELQQLISREEGLSVFRGSVSQPFHIRRRRLLGRVKSNRLSHLSPPCYLVRMLTRPAPGIL